eukprot:Selendium_serpulae@DN6111_c0_g1_i1.p1
MVNGMALLSPPLKSSNLSSRFEEYVIVTPVGGSRPAAYGWTPDIDSRAAHQNRWETTVKELTVGKGFCPRNGHSAVTLRNTVIIFGGQAGDGSLLDDMWKLTEKREWKKVVVDGPKPPARYFHKMVVNPDDDKIWLYGGFGENRHHLNDVWSFDLRGAWEKVETSGKSPKGRALHGSEIHQNQLIVFGGLELGDNPFTAVWALDLSTKQWSRKEVSRDTGRTQLREVPEPRYAHHMAIYGGNMYVAGGFSSVPSRQRQKIRDLWRFSLKDRTWQELAENFVDESLQLGSWSLHRASSICQKDCWLFFGCGKVISSYSFSHSTWTTWNLTKPLPDVCRHDVALLPPPPTRGGVRETTVTTVVITGGVVDKVSTNSTYLVFWRNTVAALNASPYNRPSPYQPYHNRPSPYQQLQQGALGPNYSITSPAAARLMLPRGGDAVPDSMSACSDQMQRERELEIAGVLDDLLSRVEQLTAANEEMVDRHQEMVAENDEIISRNQELEALVDKWKCGVCFENEVATILIPCKHMRLCSHCAGIVFRRSRPKCPDCRETVIEMMNPFLP